MKLKELKNEEHNLLDYISFFDGITNTKPYFMELIHLYGNRNLLPAIEELFKIDGLGSIGLIFDLKRHEWQDLETISNNIKVTALTETNIITNKNDSSTLTKDNKVNGTDNNVDYTVPFDVNIEHEQSKTNKNNTINTSENINNENTGKTERVHKGFDKERINTLIKLFKTYPNYRHEIYKDIVNMLCLQVYD